MERINEQRQENCLMKSKYHHLQHWELQISHTIKKSKGRKATITKLLLIWKEKLSSDKKKITKFN